MTWHPERREFVVSNWRHDFCVAATRIDVADAGELLALLAAGITDAATTGPAPLVAHAGQRQRRVVASIGRIRDVLFGRTAPERPAIAAFTVPTEDPDARHRGNLDAEASSPVQAVGR